MNLAFFLDSEKLLRDARINLDAANKRAEQAEFELVEAQSRLIAGAVYEKLDSINYWKTRAEQAEADARALATAATTSKMLRSNYENELIAKYLEAKNEQ